MAWPLAEFAPPVGPALGPAIIGLGVLVSFIVLLGLVQASKAIVKVLFYPFTHVSILGIHPFGFLNSIEGQITHYLGQAAHALESYIAWSWQAIGVVAHFLGHEIRGLAADTYHMYRHLTDVYLPRLFRSITHLQGREHAHSQALGKQATATAAHASAQAAQAARLPYWKWRRWADRQIGQAIPAEITAVGDYAGSLERRIAIDTAKLSRLQKIMAALGLAALVGTALNKLDLGHLRCRNNRRLGKALCGLPAGLLEALLGGAIEAMVVLDLCVIARIVTRLVKAFEPELRLLVVVENAALCGGQHKAPPGLAISGQPWPVPSASIAL